jgi:hypothetical protein
MTDAERIAELKTEVEATAARERSCTCHPDDKPPNPCMQKYALTECRIAELEAEAERLTRERDEALAKVLLWRDCFEEITAKAAPYGSGPPEDPSRIVSYLIPAGPLHRAAGKTGCQAFDAARWIADVRSVKADLSGMSAALGIAQSLLEMENGMRKAAEARLVRARADALEEAARLFDDRSVPIAQQIRALADNSEPATEARNKALEHTLAELMWFVPAREQ